MKVDVVVLAGGDANQVIPELRGPKSLIDIAGRPMISYVMEALGHCKDIDRIVIALPAGTDPEAFAGFPAEVVAGARGVIDSIYKAIELIGEEGYVLVVSSDTPMISGDALNDFLSLCRQNAADIYYSIIPKEAAEAVFPGTKRTYLKLKNGMFTGGNVHLSSKKAFLNNMGAGERIFNLRKNPLGIFQLLGLGFMLKYITGRLSISEIEQTAGRVFNSKVKAIITHYPELGVDVDKAEDLRLAQAYLARLNGK